MGILTGWFAERLACSELSRRGYQALTWGQQIFSRLMVFPQTYTSLAMCLRKTGTQSSTLFEMRVYPWVQKCLSVVAQGRKEHKALQHTQLALQFNQDFAIQNQVLALALNLIWEYSPSFSWNIQRARTFFFCCRHKILQKFRLPFSQVFLMENQTVEGRITTNTPCVKYLLSFSQPGPRPVAVRLTQCVHPHLGSWGSPRSPGSWTLRRRLWTRRCTPSLTQTCTHTHHSQTHPLTFNTPWRPQACCKRLKSYTLISLITSLWIMYIIKNNLINRAEQ